MELNDQEMEEVIKSLPDDSPLKAKFLKNLERDHKFLGIIRFNQGLGPQFMNLDIQAKNIDEAKIECEKIASKKLKNWIEIKVRLNE